MSATNNDPINVIVVDDDAELAASLQHYLQRRQCNVRICVSAASAIQEVNQQVPDVIVSDMRMPGKSGIELLVEVLQKEPDLPLILITAHGEIATAVEAMRLGAFDFVEKPFEPDHLYELVQRAAQIRRLNDENKRLKRRLRNLSGLEKTMIGSSPAIQHLREDVTDIANTDASVLICGETGTGKEVVARGLHDLSVRASEPFVALNCAAIPEQLFEATLFGHTAGAFTGAQKASKGQFVAANGGSIFLDELSALPLTLQPKLLRALQEREVLPVGGSATQAFDARIISASNQPLDTLVSEAKFRDDLYYRLNTIIINIPPLRARREDILLVFSARLERFAAHYTIDLPVLDSQDVAALLAHDWPGNVRELESVAERLVLASRRGRARVADVLNRVSEVDGDARTLREQVEAYEVLLIKQALADNAGDISACAEQLSIPRRTLDEKITRHKIQRDGFR